MTNERRIENIIQLTDTIWQVNKNRLIDKLEELTHAPVPDDCLTLIEFSFRNGCVAMEQTLGKEWRSKA